MSQCPACLKVHGEIERCSYPILRARIAELEKEYGELAHAVGICHEQSMGACHPGPHEQVLAQIREDKAALVAAEALIAHGQARAAKAEAEYNAAYQTVPHLSGALGEAQGEADALRAERDRYLAAIVEYVSVEDVKEIEGAYAALRRIAEEKA